MKNICCYKVRSKRTTIDESEINGRVAGTVRRHTPIDTRDPIGAVLHFYVGDSYDSNRFNILGSVFNLYLIYTVICPLL